MSTGVIDTIVILYFLSNNNFFTIYVAFVLLRTALGFAPSAPMLPSPHPVFLFLLESNYRAYPYSWINAVFVLCTVDLGVVVEWWGKWTSTKLVLPTFVCKLIIADFTGNIQDCGGCSPYNVIGRISPNWYTSNGQIAVALCKYKCTIVSFAEDVSVKLLQNKIENI